MSFVSWHPLATKFYRIFTAGGGTMQQWEIEAINVWVWENLKNGLLSNYVAYYPMICGANPGTSQSIINMSYNLISPDPFTAVPLYNLTANNITGSMCTASGYQGNGSSSYWDTGLNFNTLNSTFNNNILIGFYKNKIQTVSAAVDMGVINNSSLAIAHSFGLTNSTWASDIQCNNSNQISKTGSTTIGYFIGNRQSSSLQTIYYNGNSFANNSATSTSYPNFNCYLGALNNGGSSASWSDARFGNFIISQGLSSTQISILYQIEQNFQKMLGRAISL